MKMMVLPSSCLQFDELLLHLAADQRVEGGERLVHEQDRRCRRRARGRGPTRCCIPPDSSDGSLSSQPSSPTRFTIASGAFAALGQRNALHLEGVSGVVEHRAVRQQCEVLEHHGDALAAHIPHLGRDRSCDVDAVDGHRTRGRLDETVEHADERGLAGTGQAHDDEDLAPRHIERRIDHGGGGAASERRTGCPALESFDAIFRFTAEDLVEALNLDCCF